MKKIILLCGMLFVCLRFAYTQSANLDLSFGSNGIVRTDIGKSYTYGTSGRQVIELSSGSIYVILASGSQYFITKRNSNGSADSSFGHNGFSMSVWMDEASAALQPDGKIVLGGSVSTGFGDFEIVLARFNSDGKLDSSFSDDGKVITTP